MDFDYEGAEDFGGRILWPRIAVFLLALLLVFLLGRCTGGGGVDEAEFEAVVASNSEAQAQLTEKDASIAQLQQELIDARSAGPTTGTATPGAGGTANPTGTESPAANGDGAGTVDQGTGERTYEVQEGDTLSTIAEAVYGDPLAFGPIAEANGLGGSNVLQVGQVLTIPANPDAAGQ